MKRDSPTARQPDSPTARQPDSPTARQPDSPMKSEMFIWVQLDETSGTNFTHNFVI